MVGHQGRILIIEGIEKAERNVLPILNNLLENREMNLEDGRFLVHPARYDALLKEHPQVPALERRHLGRLRPRSDACANPSELAQSELDSWKLVRVSERFRVLALGLPVPKYVGNPLDPPLRSRYVVCTATDTALRPT